MKNVYGDLITREQRLGIHKNTKTDNFYVIALICVLIIGVSIIGTN